MKTKNMYLTLLLTLSFIITSCEKNEPLPDIQAPEIGKSKDGQLAVNFAYVLEKYQIPAIAAMTFIQGEVIEAGQSGERTIDEGNLVGQDDKWHLGSITKSMTATLSAILIEKGFLDWETTIQEIIPGSYLQAYEDVSIFELLSLSGGISGQDELFDPADRRPVREIRQEWALQALNQNPEETGTFTYSNSSYVIAGFMLETIMDQSWESLMQQYLFDPLGMEDSGFGAPQDSDVSDQPRGHKLDGNTWISYNPDDPNSDNPLALGPAGTVHTTLNDMVKYIRLHMGYEDLLTEESLSLLHSEVNESGYALGWNVNENGIFHAGSNNRWFAQLFISPDLGFANFAVTNSADNNSIRSIPAVSKILEILGKRFQNAQ